MHSCSNNNSNNHYRNIDKTNASSERDSLYNINTDVPLVIVRARREEEQHICVYMCVEIKI